MNTFKSDLSQKSYPLKEKVAAHQLRPSLLQLIQLDHPRFTEQCALAQSELNTYREKYISAYLDKETKTLSDLEKTVFAALNSEQSLVNKLEEESNGGMTFGQRIADRVAGFGGSWWFIGSFFFFILLWIGVNVFFISTRFDPYPFILLNLILSCVAAMQAPVIMMSQNRQEEKDRERAQKDYMINLKSELEIRVLHEKIDHLMLKQQMELIEIQKVQIEMMNEILAQLSKTGDKS